MNVLSLFDGISCGQVALKKAGIKVDNYYASEIEKNAIKVTQNNFPTTIQVGDVTKLSINSFPKIDLIIGGSPCQSLSRAGDGSGFDGKSKLFYEYLRILNEIKKINPNVLFLLENVKMKKEWEDVITHELGITPMKINSNISSAQNRERIYWTNIPYVYDNTNSNSTLQDILQSNVEEQYYLDDNQIQKLKYLKGAKNIPRIKNGFEYPFKEGAINFPNKLEGKSQCLIAGGQGISRTSTYVSDKNGKIRKITPIEAERLQNLPDKYTSILINDNKRYKVVGNGWTVNVIVDFFKNI